jgi:hypothetical protein
MYSCGGTKIIEEKRKETQEEERTGYLLKKKGNTSFHIVGMMDEDSVVNKLEKRREYKHFHTKGSASLHFPYRN